MLLALGEFEKGGIEIETIERGVNHLIIAANLGCDDGLETLGTFYREGAVSKEDYASAFRAHQAAIDATKRQPQRQSLRA